MQFSSEDMEILRTDPTVALPPGMCYTFLVKPSVLDRL